MNAVLLKDINDTKDEFDRWADFINQNKINFRYIELMQTGDNLKYLKNIIEVQKFLKNI